MNTPEMYGEFPQPKYELSPAGLKQRLEDICLDYLAYTVPSIDNDQVTELYLDAPTGERVLIAKALAGTQPSEDFLQDMCMVIFPSGQSSEVVQIDFSFNQFGDELLRKRVVFDRSGKHGFEIEPERANDSEVLRFTELTPDVITDAILQNIEHVRGRGTNNEPATPDDVIEAMSYLDGATVLDPNNDFQPVGALNSSQDQTF